MMKLWNIIQAFIRNNMDKCLVFGVKLRTAVFYIYRTLIAFIGAYALYMIYAQCSSYFAVQHFYSNGYSATDPEIIRMVNDRDYYNKIFKFLDLQDIYDDEEYEDRIKPVIALDDYVYNFMPKSGYIDFPVSRSVDYYALELYSNLLRANQDDKIQSALYSSLTFLPFDQEYMQAVSIFNKPTTLVTQLSMLDISYPILHNISFFKNILFLDMNQLTKSDLYGSSILRLHNSPSYLYNMPAISYANNKKTKKPIKIISQGHKIYTPNGALAARNANKIERYKFHSMVQGISHRLGISKNDIHLAVSDTMKIKSKYKNVLPIQKVNTYIKDMQNIRNKIAKLNIDIDYNTKKYQDTLYNADKMDFYDYYITTKSNYKKQHIAVLNITDVTVDSIMNVRDVMAFDLVVPYGNYQITRRSKLYNAAAFIASDAFFRDANYINEVMNISTFINNLYNINFNYRIYNILPAYYPQRETSRSISKAIKAIADNPNVSSILLRISHPHEIDNNGYIQNSIQYANKAGIEVIISASDISNSFLSVLSGADKIFMDEGSILGSGLYNMYVGSMMPNKINNLINEFKPADAYRISQIKRIMHDRIRKDAHSLLKRKNNKNFINKIINNNVMTAHEVHNAGFIDGIKSYMDVLNFMRKKHNTQNIVQYEPGMISNKRELIMMLISDLTKLWMRDNLVTKAQLKRYNIARNIDKIQELHDILLQHAYQGKSHAAFKIFQNAFKSRPKSQKAIM